MLNAAVAPQPAQRLYGGSHRPLCVLILNDRCFWLSATETILDGGRCACLPKAPKQGDRRGQSVEPLAANLVLRGSSGILGPSM